MLNNFILTAYYLAPFWAPLAAVVFAGAWIIDRFVERSS